MLVSGGTPGWARFVSFAAALGVFGVGSEACGGRTAAIDPDVYDPGYAAGGTNGSGGKRGGSTPTAGVASGGVGGTVDTSESAAVCQDYCAAYAKQCKKRLMGQDCFATCMGELNGFGQVCQSLGFDALRCLTPFFSPKGGNCDVAVNNALGVCGPSVTDFQDCKGGASSSPMPVGTPNGIRACPSTGATGSSGSCKTSFTCAQGSFTTFCAPAANSAELECGCANASGATKMSLLPLSKDPCLEATALCP